MRTRETIRREALRLFDTRGYANTTVEQIATAADVSPSTFFRYFANKAALLIPDQLMDPIVAAFLAAPPELRPIAAYRYAVEQTFNAMAGTEWEGERARQSLLYTLPEGQAALYVGYIRTIDQITEALATRVNLPVTDYRLRVSAGAMAGVMMTALDGNPMPPKEIYRALEFLDAGLPLLGDE
jgi:AcrR family transcriptional regulator